MVARARTLKRSFYERPAELVAGSLIGKIFSYGPLSGRIVEVEAYDESGASQPWILRTSKGQRDTVRSTWTPRGLPLVRDQLPGQCGVSAGWRWIRRPHSSVGAADRG